MNDTQLAASVTLPRRIVDHVGADWIAALTALGVVRVTMMIFLPLSDTTEARYAEIARNMLETGDWIAPQFDYGVPFWGKPPLHTWMSALGLSGFGVSEFGARLPILCASVLILWLIFQWIKHLRDSSSALMAVSVLASSVLFFRASGFVMTDIPMTLGVTLCMIGVFRCITQNNKLWGQVAFLGIAIGLLAKGPVALVLCVIPIALWKLSRRDAHLPHLPWVSGTVTLMVVTLPWYVLAELKTPGFVDCSDLA